ncbi:MAG: TPM domain-containing protein [Bacteroidales bacterium]|jgi:uncharacterized membrane protein|nr:TPM domain-containing protein [Bacteroidales bacterium]
MNFRKFVSEVEEKAIVEAIGEAEQNTSGEIRVHFESKCGRDVMGRAVYIFYYLGMDKTKLHNGILFYVALKSKKFAIIGGSGINSKVPDDFWDSIKERMQEAFSREDFAGGLCNAISEAGKSLKSFFPYQSDDVNELPDDISIGK